jgi:hypothetical protein
MSFIRRSGATWGACRPVRAGQVSRTDAQAVQLLLISLCPDPLLHSIPVCTIVERGQQGGSGACPFIAAQAAARVRPTARVTAGGLLRQ